jgi:lipooligosaccharide transport system permease protein
MTGRTAFLRIIPPVTLMGGRRAVRLLERNVMVYRRLWGLVASGFFEPVFYLFSIGVGLGALVPDLTGPGGEPIRYAVFVAPALLAASAMNGPIFESFNVFFKIKYAKTYDGILATPLQPGDIALGEIVWSQIRGGLYSFGFVIVMFAFALSPSPWGILALPAALLAGLAFGAVGMAATTYMRSWQDFDLVTLIVMPMFLFSATFYPISIYPGWLQPLVRFSPLYHTTDLIRACTLGAFDWSILGHIAVLLAMTAVGLAILTRRIERLLLK